MSIVTRGVARAGTLGGWRTFSWSLAAVPLIALVLLAAVAFAADRAYAQRALPGVSVAGVEVSGLTTDAAAEQLRAALSAPIADRAIVAAYGARTWRTTNGAAGLSPDIAAAADAAVAYGKRGSLAERAAAWLAALRGHVEVPLAMGVEGDALDRWIAAIAADVDTTDVSGSLAVGPGGLIVTEPVTGAILDRAATRASILAARSLGDRAIAPTVHRVHPEVDESGLHEALARARAATAALTVTAEDRRVSEDAAGLATLLDIRRVVARGGEVATLPAGVVPPRQRYRYEVAISEARLGAWVSALAARLDRPGVSARYTVSADGIVGVVAGVTGIRVDQDGMRALLLAELQGASEGTREVAAPLVADTTAFTTEQAREWLPKLVRTSTFTTQFSLNASRHANIATGSAQFDGVVIMPGRTFSFWELLGPVTPERGYANAGAIINGRSDDSVIGGGLCQVSTTLFNAVATLGYEIVERHAHGYLIERYPTGLDAAVFLPGSDLRWRNDTASPVFLWSWVGDTSVTFDVWGLPTGRTVTFSAPLQRNFVDVPKDQPADPAFPKGYAIPGRDVIVTRTVSDGGTVLHQDTFFSRYVPVWGGPAPAPEDPPKTP